MKTRTSLILAALLLVVGGGGGCRVRPCKPGTVLLSVELQGSTSQADQLQVTVTLQTETIQGTIAHALNQASGTVELTFPRAYPSGQLATVRVLALAGGIVRGAGQDVITLDGSCAHLALSVSPLAPDAGVDFATTLSDLSGGPIDQSVGDVGPVDGATLTDAAAPRDLSTPRDMAHPTGDMTNCSAVASATHYVDPAHGRDIATNGGLPGSCAYKTITYALTQASGLINLAQTTYSTGTGETFPLVLNGTQQIDCNPGVNGYATGATITGAAQYNGTSDFSAVAFQGTANVIKSCNLQTPGGAAGMGVTVNSAGNQAVGGHIVEYSQISAGLYGVHILATGSNVNIVSNNMSNCVTSIVWLSSGPGAMTSNTVGGPMYGIGCTATPTTSITGVGNTYVTGTCTGCAGCPF